MLLKENEIGELKEKAKAHEKQVWEANRDRDQFEEQIKDLQLQNQQLKQSRETQMHALDRDLAAKVSYITTLESQVQTHEKEIKKLKDINTLISQEKVTLAKLNQDFANKVEDMTKKIDHLD
jgi:chromosome segregation ATPase